MPIIFRAAIKPTPSISMPQKSISLSAMENTTLTVTGRHDPCIVPRAVPVVEAAAAIAIYDLILGNTQTDRRKSYGTQGNP
jgi:chorismate synthase